MIKKFGHFTDEHAKFEKELLSMPEARRKEYLAELEKNAEKRPSWLRRAWPTKYDKFGKSLGWIDKCNSIQSLKTRLQNYVSIGKPLSAGENISLKDALTKAIATVELHKEE